jgi:quinohemoprotein ethanol dehydrogenase
MQPMQHKRQANHRGEGNELLIAGGPGGRREIAYALNAATGAIKWKYQSQGRGGTNRGVVAAEGKVFSSGGGNTLLALDQQSGALLWTVNVGDRGSTVAPAFYYDGLVYMGVSGGEGGVRGFFGAYDAKTGKQVWGFWTVPGPGELGHDTWEGSSWTHGGGPVWTHPAIDPDLGMIYVPVGNAAPDNDGTQREGDNLFTASVVALDLKTGAYKWHYQEVHHDLWDYDNSASPILADTSIAARREKS